jgi:DNA-binding FrmR family transcriptional regulator
MKDKKVKSVIEIDKNEDLSENIEFNTTSKELVHRLNRIIGQLESIKRGIQTESDKDCVQTIRLLKAANNAIKKFGEAYVNEHLTKCINTGVSSKDLEQGLKDVIGSVFNM